MIDDIEVTFDKWLNDRNNWNSAYIEYGFQNAGYLLDDTVNELKNTFIYLGEYLGLEWHDDILYKKEDKPYSDSLWKEHLIGYWETIDYESFSGWATLTLYEDGIAELHVREGVCFGTFEIESNGNVKIRFSDEYLYNNADDAWLHFTVNWQVRLSESNNIMEMNITCINDYDGTFPFYGSLNLTKIDDIGADYSSADTLIQDYRNKVSN